MKIENCLKLVWNYLIIKEKLEPAQAIFVFGRDDFKIPAKALEIYKRGLSPRLILLGGRGRLSGKLKIAESEAFRDFLIKKGMSKKVLYIENRSTNTGENLDEGLGILKNKSIKADRIILITHAPHSRRTLASAEKRNSKIIFLSCPDNCRIPKINSPRFINEVKEAVGEMERILTYPKKGFIKKQIVPNSVRTCHKILKNWLIKRS